MVTATFGWKLAGVGAVQLASWAVAEWAVAASESLVSRGTEVNGLTEMAEVARWMDSVMMMRASKSEAGVLTCIATTIGSDAPGGAVGPVDTGRAWGLVRSVSRARGADILETFFKEDTGDT